ncbi:glucosyltransferase domain-containing protein [Synechococcus sp. FACHB-909]|uniref:glucosyltransferase domain-containing protein n=1 Tax=Synechococcus sp. FACHB-909 TaxID=2692863 RepID=UPI00168A09B5|nr:glucosyltransferase domain-containing protein [Synechococcus sp. FACHB-909]MBD2720407.1 glucosyltransferase domain-containing protein [Synechococcus sp. FACHB-909]
MKKKPESPSADLLALFLSSGLTPTAALAQFVFACVAMGGFMFSHGLNIDEELGLFTPFSISLQGRFSLELLGQILQPPGVLPLAPYALLAAAYIISYNTIVSIHGLRHSWRTQLGFLIFILFPTNWLTQEYSGLAAGLALGLICTSTAALLTVDRIRNQRPPLQHSLLSVLTVALLVLALSTFQSQITVYFAIGMGVTLFSISQAESHQSAFGFTSLRTWIVYGVASVLAYALTVKAYLTLTGQNIQHVNIYFRSPYFMLRTEPLQYITGNLEQYTRTYLTPGFFYGHPLWGLPLLLIGALILYFIYCGPARDLTQASGIQLKAGWQGMLGWLSLLAIPLALNIVSKPYRIPMRALFAVPYVAWLASMVWMELAAGSRRLRILMVGAALSCVLILQSLITISHYYAARAFNQRADQLVANTVASVIATSSKQTPRVSRIATDGSLQREQPYRTGWYSFAGSSFFNWDGGSALRISAWLRAMGIPGLKPVEEKEKKRFETEFATMKPWPQPGSIQVNDDTVLIKLS